jgi:hypothetical protein
MPIPLLSGAGERDVRPTTNACDARSPNVARPCSLRPYAAAPTTARKRGQQPPACARVRERTVKSGLASVSSPGRRSACERAKAHPGRHEDTMSLCSSSDTPADVFYVVQSAGALGRREHRLASVLYETRLHAHNELARLSAAAHPGDYAIWKSTTYIEPPHWGHAVMRADGTMVPPASARRALR